MNTRLLQILENLLTFDKKIGKVTGNWIVTILKDYERDEIQFKNRVQSWSKGKQTVYSRDLRHIEPSYITIWRLAGKEGVW